MKPNTPTPPSYPSEPGFKEKGGTSQLAAEGMKITASLIREQVLHVFEANGNECWTPETVAHVLGLDILSVRPRFTELKERGFIEKTGKRIPSPLGKHTTVATWRLVPPSELKQGDLFK